MKKALLVLSLVSAVFISCGETKKENAKEEVKKEELRAAPEENNTEADLVAEGKKLFAAKTCTTCHQVDQKVIGPSIKDINKIYTEQNGDYLAFLKGEADAIVDTDPGQVAIMKANLDSFVKDLTEDELTAIITYMKSVK